MADFLDKFKANMERKSSRVAPPARRQKRLFDRCTAIHEGQRITFDLTTAKTCPPGFFGIKNGGGVRVVKVERTTVKPERAAARPKAAKKAAPKKKAAKKAAPKKKAAKKTNGNGNGGTMTVASVKERLAKLYKQKKPGEASKLRAKARKAGLAV